MGGGGETVEPDRTQQGVGKVYKNTKIQKYKNTQASKRESERVLHNLSTRNTYVHNVDICGLHIPIDTFCFANGVGLRVHKYKYTNEWQSQPGVHLVANFDRFPV